MSSLIVLSLLIVAIFVVLCHLFNESRIELDPPTIAAMEARVEAAEAAREAERDVEEKYSGAGSDETMEATAEMVEFSPGASPAGYEYREMLEEGGENYVLPQWMVNFFSSSDIAHALDPAGKLVFIAKLNDARNVEEGVVDISAECDMGTQTISLNLCFGEGAPAETVRTKFYLFERGDLFELSRLVHQNEVRIDILRRAADYTLEYACSIRAQLPQSVLLQLNNTLAKIPS